MTTFIDVSTGFQTQLGFIQASNFRNNHTHATYQWFPKNRFYQSFGLETDQNVAFDHQGDRVFHYSTFDVFWLLPRNIVIAPIIGENSDTVSPLNYAGLTNFKNFTENFGGIVFRGAPWSQFNFNLTGPAQRQRELQPGRRADSFAAQPGDRATALYRAAGSASSPPTTPICSIATTRWPTAHSSTRRRPCAAW